MKKPALMDLTVSSSSKTDACITMTSPTSSPGRESSVGGRAGRRAGRRAGSSASPGSRSNLASSLPDSGSSLASSLHNSGSSLARRTRSAETGRAVFTGNMTGAISSTQGQSCRVGGARVWTLGQFARVWTRGRVAKLRTRGRVARV